LRILNPASRISHLTSRICPYLPLSALISFFRIPNPESRIPQLSLSALICSYLPLSARICSYLFFFASRIPHLLLTAFHCPYLHLSALICPYLHLSALLLPLSALFCS